MPNIRRGMMGASGVSTGPVYVGAPPDGYRAWYRADTVTEAGGAVSQWDDKSGNDFHIGVMDTDYKPTLNTADSNLNDMPSINLGIDDGDNPYKFYNSSGSPDFQEILDNTTAAIFEEFTMIFVYYVQGASNFNYSSWFGDNPGFMWFGLHNATQFSTGNDTFYSPGGQNESFGSILNAQGGTDGSITITVETSGETTTTYTSWNSYDRSHGRTAGVTIGGGGTSAPGMYVKGQLADVIIYNTSLDATDTNTVKDYIANSYGITW